MLPLVFGYKSSAPKTHGTQDSYSLLMAYQAYNTAFRYAFLYY